MKLNPYLTFNGECETAFQFYEQCLGGKNGKSPIAEQVPSEWRNKILHATLLVGEDVLMALMLPLSATKHPKAFPCRFRSRTRQMRNAYFMH